MRLINVDALKESFGDERLDGDWCIYGDETTARDLIDEAPIIEAEPVRHGKWIFGETKGHSWMKCSQCLKSQSGQTACFAYCPDCGAKMDLND